MIKFYPLEQVFPLGACVYYVRSESRSGDGRMFYSEAIARQWAIEQAAMTGAKQGIWERLAT